jgi:hypothetical protein
MAEAVLSHGKYKKTQPVAARARLCLAPLAGSTLYFAAMVISFSEALVMEA